MVLVFYTYSFLPFWYMVFIKIPKI